MATAVAALKTLSFFRTLGITSRSFREPRGFKRHLHCSFTLLSQKSTLTIRECYSLLGLNEGEVNESEVRASYFKLAKQYHPDSGKTTADPEKFARIDYAYKAVLKYLSQKPVEEAANEIEEDKFDIKHTAPQHRRYLEYDGMGTGTPSMREKQYRHHRFEQAVEGVFTHKTKQHGTDETSIAKPEKKAIKKAMISGAIERMVEDLIQEAISKGEFKNLPGSGKPIKHDPLRNQYMDSGTHRLNKVLLDSGYVPDWIALEKEIREDYATLKEMIRLKRSQLGPMPFTKENLKRWSDFKESLTERVKLIDGKIDKLNLIVPILNRQKVHIRLEKTIDKIFEEYGYGRPELFLRKGNSTLNKDVSHLDIDSDVKSDLTKIYREYLSPVISWIFFYFDGMFQHFKAKYVNKNQ